jgi:asparagine synthetase B (glutamine-hydrolysing)
MCGIVGIARRSSGFVIQLIRMSRAQQHRGTDDEGFAIVGLNHSAQFLQRIRYRAELAYLPHVGAED